MANLCVVSNLPSLFCSSHVNFAVKQGCPVSFCVVSSLLQKPRKTEQIKVNHSNLSISRCSGFLLIGVNDIRQLIMPIKKKTLNLAFQTLFKSSTCFF